MRRGEGNGIYRARLYRKHIHKTREMNIDNLKRRSNFSFISMRQSTRDLLLLKEGGRSNVAVYHPSMMT